METDHKPGVQLVELTADDEILVDQVQEVQAKDAEITLCALVGNPSPSTMRVKSRFQDQEVVTLIDSVVHNLWMLFWFKQVNSGHFSYPGSEGSKWRSY